jgi:serine/threonine protein kinase
VRLQEGQVLDGRYTLVHRLGSGGMADVWRAEDAGLGREVALKVLHENFARDAEFVERFRREASAAAKLQHPNVVASSTAARSRTPTTSQWSSSTAPR